MSQAADIFKIGLTMLRTAEDAERHKIEQSRMQLKAFKILRQFIVKFQLDERKRETDLQKYRHIPLRRAGKKQ